MEERAPAYLRQGVVPPKYAANAARAAVCTVARLQYLVSWNIKHLGDVQREAGFNAVHRLQGYPAHAVPQRPTPPTPPTPSNGHWC